VTQGALPAHYGYGYPALGGYYGRRKRDADADADAEALYGYYGYAAPYGLAAGYAASPLASAGYAATPLAAAGYAAGPLVASVPFGSSTGLDPITQGLDAATQGYSPYSGYGYPYGLSSGYHFGK